MRSLDGSADFGVVHCQGGAFDISMRLFAPLQLLSEKKRRVHKALGIEEAGPRWVTPDRPPPSPNDVQF